MAFSPDGQWVATSSTYEQIARVRYIKGNQPEILLKGHSGKINSIAFSPNGNYLITASNDHTAKIWDRQGKLIRTLTGHRNDLTTAFFSPSGMTVVTASKDHEARIWNIYGSAIYEWLKNANIYRLTAEERQEFGLTPQSANK